MYALSCERGYERARMGAKENKELADPERAMRETFL